MKIEMQTLIARLATAISAVAITAAVIAGVSGRASAQQPVSAIRCGRLIDGSGGAVIENAVIIIEAGRIRAAGAGIEIPAGADIIDLSGSTVLPGLIDCHTHLLLHDGPYLDQLIRESVPYRAILGTVAAKKTLDAGFTTVRDVETEGAMYADVDLRNAIAAGHIPGPRVLAATRALVPTGAYAPYGISWELDVPRGAQFADGVDGVRLAVREQIMHGADWIKIYADSRFRHRDADSLVGSKTFTDEEMRAIVEEAGKVGVGVVAHAYTSEAAQRAVKAGVRSIDHGLYLDEATFRLMKDKGVYWVPTLLAYYAATEDTTLDEKSMASWKYTVARHKESFQRALKSGVKIAFGTDMYFPHGDGDREFGLMADYGMDEMKIIQSATSVAAGLLGLQKITGSIQPGLQADIVAVKGDPLADIRTLENVHFVMKGGIIHRNEAGK